MEHKKKAYSCKIFTVWEEEVQFASGAKAKQSWIEHKPTVAIVAVNENKELLMIRQFRLPPAPTFWKFPPDLLMTMENLRSTARNGNLRKKPVSAPDGSPNFSPAICCPAIATSICIFFWLKIWSMIRSSPMKMSLLTSFP